MKAVVTTPQSVDAVNQDLADFIHASGLEYIPRQKASLHKIALDHCADAVIVWETAGPVVYLGTEKLFFHPSMAKCRLAAFRKQGRQDLMVKACQLTPGDSFLDCTLGMGADAIVAAYFSGTGKITGLESQPVLAGVISWGMKLYQGQMDWLNQAIHRIEVVPSHHADFLRQQADQSYDIIYFDPMFARPLLQSQPLAPLRKMANHAALEASTIQEACRVARQRVVLKTLASGSELERLGFSKVVGSKHNPIIYGIIGV
ncbi:MAG: class I SAM-dependent methyltransferase [Firmicutes bacterium]|nr:class I SAM-dependent methyltransferase [Bacillota bacterium]